MVPDRVVTPSTVDVVSLSELRAYVNVSSSGSDAELVGFLDAAHDVVEGIIGPILHRPVTQTVTPSSGRLFLQSWPVVSVQSVTADGSPVTAGWTWTPDGTVSGVLSYVPVVVSYTAGRSKVPESVAQAILIIAGHLWETQRGAAPSPLADPDQGQQFGAGFAVPNRAVELLRPYAAASSGIA